MGMCGIILGLNGVLCYIDHYHYLAWKAVTDRLSLPFDEQVNNHLRGASQMGSLEIIPSLSSETYPQEEKEQMAAEKNRLYRNYLKRMGSGALVPGAVDVLRTLRKNSWKIGIDSSGGNTSPVLERTGLNGFFNTVADGDQVTKSKPDPKVSRLAARKLHLSPDECAVVEDASAGILAADVGGSFPIGLGGAVQAPGYRAILNALYELPELCRRLYSRAPRSKPSNPAPFSQGGGAVKKEEHPPGR